MRRKPGRQIRHAARQRRARLHGDRAEGAMTRQSRNGVDEIPVGHRPERNYLGHRGESLRAWGKARASSRVHPMFSNKEVDRDE